MRLEFIQFMAKQYVTYYKNIVERRECYEIKWLLNIWKRVKLYIKKKNTILKYSGTAIIHHPFIFFNVFFINMQVTYMLLL